MKRTALTVFLLATMSLAAAGPASADPTGQTKPGPKTEKPQKIPAKAPQKAPRKGGEGSGPQAGPIHFWMSGRGWHNYDSDAERRRMHMVKGEQEAMRKARVKPGSTPEKFPVHFTRTSHRGWHVLFTSTVHGGDARR